MSETYSFDAAGEALTAIGAAGKPKKDCSAKHDKVYQLENKLKEVERDEAKAAKEAKDARDEYLLWRNDPEKGPYYGRVYREKTQAWSMACDKMLDVKKKLHAARDAAWNCEAQAAFG